MGWMDAFLLRPGSGLEVDSAHMDLLLPLRALFACLRVCFCACGFVLFCVL